MTNSKIITNFLNDTLKPKAEYTEGFVDNARYNWHLFHKFYWVFRCLEFEKYMNVKVHEDKLETIKFLMVNDKTPEAAFDKLAEAVMWFNSL